MESVCELRNFFAQLCLMFPHIKLLVVLITPLVVNRTFFAGSLECGTYWVYTFLQAQDEYLKEKTLYGLILKICRGSEDRYHADVRINQQRE